MLLAIGGRQVEITRPEKVLFPDDGITKQELVAYYRGVTDLILPHLEDRPLMLERYPDGIGERPLIQKAASKYFPDWIPRVTVPKKGGTVAHVVCNDEATLAYLANQACVTPHTWLSRRDQLDTPDQMVFDLDPSGSDFGVVKNTAVDLHGLLDQAKLPNYVKTTGSRGLHVVVPLKREADFGAVHGAARRIAEHLIAMDPKNRTLEFMKADRGGRVFIDIHRIAWAQNYAPAWSVRPRPGAPVSVPLAWDELDRKDLRPDGWTIRTLAKRLEKTGDPWAGFWKSAVKLKQ